jgi:hypothetical protein
MLLTQIETDPAAAAGLNFRRAQVNRFNFQRNILNGRNLAQVLVNGFADLGRIAVSAIGTNDR